MTFKQLFGREEYFAKKFFDEVPNAFRIHKKLRPGVLGKVILVKV